MTKYKILSWTAVFLWMALLFYMSAQVADQSNQMSSGITEAIIKFTEKILPQANFDISGLHHIVRKNAHFFGYFVLGILSLNALRRSGLQGCKSIVVALLICCLYSISDEVHQLFVIGRSGQIKDVIIDTAGASVGVGVYWLTSRLTINRGERKACQF